MRKCQPKSYDLGCSLKIKRMKHHSGDRRMERFISCVIVGGMLGMGVVAFAQPEDGELQRVKAANAELLRRLKDAHDTLKATRDALALCRDSQEGSSRPL
jgi:hypothetical protein